MSALSGVRTILELQAEADTLGLGVEAAGVYIDAEHDADMLKLEVDPTDIRPLESLRQWRAREHPKPARRHWWNKAA